MKIFIVLFLLVAIGAQATETTELQKRSCKSPEATVLVKHGFELQKDSNTPEALKAYQQCLAKEPACVDCLYEIGWSYWKLGEWQKVIQTWQEALRLKPDHSEIPKFLPTAKQNLEAIDKKVFRAGLKQNVDLMIQSSPADAPVTLTFTGRWQSYNKNATNPLDRFDSDIDSPKSVNFSPDGQLAYVNSLEGAKTVIFNAAGNTKKAVIKHRFTVNEKNLFSKGAPFGYTFPKTIKNPNQFSGKPVEGVFSHDGKYFFVPYYRRSFDDNGQYPSALAVIDTNTKKILRVMGVGPISKYVEISPDGKWLAVSHWGDNTIGLFDISAPQPSGFKEVELLVVEKRLPKAKMIGNRDHNCGFCVRGLAFTPDSRHLFVGRMSRGGIAVFDLESRPRKYLGTIDGISPGPRDLHIGPLGKNLYISCNATGFIWKVPIATLFDTLKEKSLNLHFQYNPKAKGAISGFAGLGVRSIKLSPDSEYVFASVNQTSEVVAFRTSDMSIVSRISVDSYPVGLALSPDGSQLWVTSQGRQSKGGNSVGIFQVRYKNKEIIMKTNSPVSESPLPKPTGDQ